ncbi:hypothetical protein B0T19DRAFT_203144 [Cercophora scortea]|uniref:Uncharacterized protein n=1 Tax=Cercophora scortea TaxID=314031 RepID=A0AAE0M9F6_9PEZI|nr:hypothetical protein B0T19DRAFT_203144 [Cercophora scortea]
MRFVDTREQTMNAHAGMEGSNPQTGGNMSRQSAAGGCGLCGLCGLWMWMDGHDVLWMDSMDAIRATNMNGTGNGASELWLSEVQSSWNKSITRPYLGWPAADPKSPSATCASIPLSMSCQCMAVCCVLFCALCFQRRVSCSVTGDSAPAPAAAAASSSFSSPSGVTRCQMMHDSGHSGRRCHCQTKTPSLVSLAHAAGEKKKDAKGRVVASSFRAEKNYGREVYLVYRIPIMYVQILVCNVCWARRICRNNSRASIKAGMSVAMPSRCPRVGEREGTRYRVILAVMVLQGLNVQTVHALFLVLCRRCLVAVTWR